MSATQGRPAGTHESEVVRDLMRDPIIVGIAERLPAGTDTDTVRFDMKVAESYRMRGGRLPVTVSAPADAVRALLEQKGSTS